MATAVHWCLTKKYGFPVSDQWYHRRAEAKVENKIVRICWDLNLYTDHVIEARQPDIVVVKKEASECLLIDIAVPGDVRVEKKEDEKVEEYIDLCRELRKL